MQIDANSASITIGTSGLKHAASVVGNAVWFHLNKGFQPGKGPTGPAMNFSAKVNVQSNAAEAANWRFAFIQVMKLEEFEAVYVGKTPGDGESVLRVKSSFLLDSEASVSPWTSKSKGTFVSSGRMEAAFGDHPSSKAGMNMVNRLTNSVLFLRRFVDRRSAFTAFVAEDPGGNRQVLATIMWLLNYQYTLKWNGSKVVVDQDMCQYFRGNSKPGLFGDAPAKTVINNPKPPLYNPHTQGLLRQALLSGPPKREDVDYRQEPKVPADFIR